MMRQRPAELQARLGHFTEAVYLISLCEEYNPGKRGGGAVLGVNLVRKIDQPLQVTGRPLLHRGPDVEVASYPAQVWHQQQGVFNLLEAARIVAPSRVEHFLGGPVEPAEPFALVDIPPEVLEAVKRIASTGVSEVDSVIDPGLRRKLTSSFEVLPAQRVYSLASKLRVKGNIYFGELSVVFNLLSNIYLQVGPRLDNCCLLGDSPIKVYWGYASWNTTQLLGEIARLGWGLVMGDPSMSFATWENSVGCWDTIVDKSLVAKESEFSQ